MFLQASVILSTGGGGLPQCMLGYHPPGADTPQEQTPPGEDTPQGPDPPDQTPLGADPPRIRHPPGSDTPRIRPPPDQTPPPPEADASIRSMSGRYAFYWNAFSLLI